MYVITSEEEICFFFLILVVNLRITFGTDGPAPPVFETINKKKFRLRLSSADTFAFCRACDIGGFRYASWSSLAYGFYIITPKNILLKRELNIESTKNSAEHGAT